MAQRHLSVVLFFISAQTTRLRHAVRVTWRRQPQQLGLSRLTKGSCNCFSWATDCTVAVNVTGYNERRLSDTELRGQRSRGASEGGSPWFKQGQRGQLLHRRCLVSARVSCCLCPLVSAVRVGTNKVTAATTVWKNSAAHRSVFT